MFRPINSDDYTRFRPPAEHVRQTDPTHPGQKRDFAYEIEQIEHDKKREKEPQQEPFGEDTFEHTDSPPDHEREDSPERDSSKPTPPAGHVDLEA
ncbi:MAG: hypothetical protein H6508_02210 [Calditrichaeota bacterium]|nr:hypothetical protein [Calditrichota bacterium]